MQAFQNIAQNWLTSVASGHLDAVVQVIETSQSDRLAEEVSSLAFARGVKVFSIEYAANSISDPLDVVHVILHWYGDSYGHNTIEDLIEECSYPLHINILKAWYRRESHFRQEPILFDEAGYEELEFYNTLERILSRLTELKPFVVMINQLDVAPRQIISALLRLLDARAFDHGWGMIGFIRHSRTVRRIKESDVWQECLRRLERRGLVLPINEPAEKEVPKYPWYRPLVLKSFDDQFRMIVSAADMFGYRDVIQMVDQIRRRYNDQHNGQLLFVSAFSSLMTNDMDAAVRDFAKVQNRLQSTESQAILVGSYYWQSICFTMQTREKEARAAQEQCEKLALEYQDNRWYVLSQFATFYINAHIAQHQLTQASLESLRFMLSQLRYDNILALAQTQVYAHSEHPDKVSSKIYLKSCVQALRTARRLQNLMGMSMSLHAMGVVYMRIGNSKQTLRLYEHSLRIREGIHRKADLVPMLNALGYFLVGQEEWQKAWDLFDRALNMLIEYRNFNEVSITFYNFIWVYLQSGNHQRALDVLNDTMELMRIRNVESVPFRNLKDLNVLKGWLHLKLNQPIQARYCLIRVQNLKHLHATSFSSVLQCVLSARLAFTEGESLIAVKENNKALDMLTEINDLDVYLSNTLKMEIARLFMDLRRNDDARPLLAELRERAHRLSLDSLAQRVSRVSLGISSLSETILPEIRQPVHVLMDIARKETQLVEMHQELTEIQQVNLLVEMSNEEPDLKTFLKQVIGVLDRRVPAEDFAIFLVNEESPALSLDVVISNDVSAKKIEFWREYLLNHTQKIARVENEGMVCVAWPLKMGSVEHAWLAISGDAQQQSVWNETFLALIAQQLGLILDRRLREEYLERQNKTDLLTGILNRAGLTERLQKQFAQMKRKPEQAFALCYFDLDHFKYFNDQFGHELGDQVLINLTQTVTEHLRGSDELGRVGGDEFIILLRETGGTEARQLMERIRQLIAAPDWWLPLLLKENNSQENPVPKEEWISASFGVVVVDRWPDDGINRIDLIAQGDAAMYEAKSQGKNCVVIREFQPNR